MLHATALTLAVLAGQTWTVDDDGRADFSEISRAIPAVATEDVLLVAPGEYSGFVLDKPLTIVGRAGADRPNVNGDVVVSSAGGFHLANLNLRRVTVNGVLGGGNLDDCTIAATDATDAALVILDSTQVIVARADIHGYSPESGPGAAACRVSDSRAVFVSCQFTGGDGAFGAGLPEVDGGAGLVVEAESNVTFARGMVVGGAAGGNADNCFIGSTGDGMVITDSFASVRGSPADSVLGGQAGDCGGVEGSSFVVAGSTLILNNVTYEEVEEVQPLVGENKIVTPRLGQPVLENLGKVGPDSQNMLQLFGEPGQFALLYGGNDEVLQPVYGLGEDLWFSARSIFFVGGLTTQGFEAPANCPYVIPDQPIFWGATARFQAGFALQPDPLDPMAASASNPVTVIVLH